MATATDQKTKLERLSRSVTVAGFAAEIAEVTSYYRVDSDTGVATEYGTPTIVVLWGVTVAQKRAELDSRKAAALARAAEEAKALDDLKKDIP